MKQLFLALAFVGLFSSCSVKTYPLKGQYPETPIRYTSDKTYEQTWDRIVDLFSESGIPIKLVDKSSGLIISDRVQFMCTYESKKGVVYHPEASIVLKRTSAMDEFSDKYMAKQVPTVYGEWNIHLKRNADSTVSMTINIVGTEMKVVSGTTSGWSSTPIYSMSPINVTSTGVFEKTINEYVSGKETHVKMFYRPYATNE